MATQQRIAVAGASGNLGPAVVSKLVDAGFSVTILSRSASADNSSSGPKTVAVDYASQDSIASALRGHDALVNLITDYGAQPRLIDAAIAAGVPRIIPAEFGSNVSGNARTASLPVFEGKRTSQAHLRANAGRIAWTLIVTGIFLDFALDFGLGINVKGDRPVTTVYDDGNTPVSTTRLAAVADAVVGVLRHPEETRDRTVYVQEAAVTQNQLLAYAEKRKPGLRVERKYVPIREVEEAAHAKLRGGRPEDVKPAMFDFIVVSLFDSTCGQLWADKNDNELLGVRSISEAEIEDEVARHL